MSSYPSAVYSPRTKQNKAGVIYAPEETTKLFAEDIVKLDDEVVAIETELGDSPKAGYADVASRLSGIEGSIPADFTDLGDVPSAFTDQGGKIVAVNEEETALEFIDAPSGGGGNSVITHIHNNCYLNPNQRRFFKVYRQDEYDNMTTSAPTYKIRLPACTIKKIHINFWEIATSSDSVSIEVYKNATLVSTTTLTSQVEDDDVVIDLDISLALNDNIYFAMKNNDTVHGFEPGFEFTVIGVLN